MDHKIVKINKCQSQYGGYFYRIMFEGGAYTQAFPEFKGRAIHNFKNWKKAMDKFNEGKEVVVQGLKFLYGNLIDADSKDFKILPDKIDAEQMKLGLDSPAAPGVK